ncbi:MAG: dihydropteroate synthase [Bacillota bacterium]
MILVGERINGQFTSVGRAIQNKDGKVIQDLALAQLEAGADYLDVNVGTAVPAREKADAMVWLVETIQEVTDAPLALDTPIEAVMRAGLSAVKRPPMINSTNADPEQLSEYIDLAMKHEADLIALTMDKGGVPNDVAKRVELGANIVVAAMEAGFPFDKLFIDLIVLPVGAMQAQAGIMLEALTQLQGISDPAPHFIVGLSNVSQNTVERSLINRTYLVMCMASGLDAAIADPLDTELVDAMITTELLLNRQIYSDSFLAAYRSGK